MQQIAMLYIALLPFRNIFSRGGSRFWDKRGQQVLHIKDLFQIRGGDTPGSAPVQIKHSNVHGHSDGIK
jgi:hypothetical protein